jgi:hypothetical protein
MGIGGYVDCATEQWVKRKCWIVQYYRLGAIKTSPSMFSAPFLHLN